MHGVRRALILATAERYVSLTVNFIVLVVAARLLSPAEFGVVVLGTSAGLIIAALREFVTPAILIQQERALEDSDVATSFTLLFLLSGCIAAVLVALAETISHFYDQSSLAHYVRIVAAAAMVETVVLPVTAVLKRQMRFGAVTAIAGSGAAVGGAVTLGLAFLGFGALSFAWGWLAGATWMALLCIALIAAVGWFRPSLKNWRRVLAFGAYTGANALLHRLYESVPLLAFGRLMPLDALGLYNRATSLCQLPEKILLGGVTSVILPALSSELRTGGSMKAAYLSGVEHITALYWPALISLALLADPAVMILLGPQWQHAVPLVQILAVASLSSFSAELNYPMLIAIGAMRDLLVRSLIAWPLSALILVMAAPFGVVALASASLIVVPLQSYVSIYFVRRHIPIPWREIAKAAHKSVLVTASTGASVLVGRMAAEAYDHTTTTIMLVSVLAGATGWIIGLSATGHPLMGELHKLWARRGHRGVSTATAKPLTARGNRAVRADGVDNG